MTHKYPIRLFLSAVLHTIKLLIIKTAWEKVHLYYELEIITLLSKKNGLTIRFAIKKLNSFYLNKTNLNVLLRIKILCLKM